MGKRAKLAPSSRSSRAMARLWLFLCGFVALLSAGASSAAQPERCSIPEEVNNAEIKVNNNNLLNATLRYRCKDGYKRKAGTSSLILCQKDSITNMLHWTQPNIICIRDPALPPLTSSPRQTTLAPRTTSTRRASTRIMLSSVGLPILIITAVALGCLWRRVHRRQHYRIPMPAIPMRVVESEQRGGTPPPDDDTQGPPHPTEETKMMPSSCATPTG